MVDKTFRVDQVDGLLLSVIYKTNKWFLVKDLSNSIGKTIKPKNNKALESFIRSRINKYLSNNLVIRKKVYDSIYAYKINKRNVVFGDSDLIIKIGNKNKKFNFDTLLGIKIGEMWYFLKV